MIRHLFNFMALIGTGLVLNGCGNDTVDVRFVMDYQGDTHIAARLSEGGVTARILYTYSGLSPRVRVVPSAAVPTITGDSPVWHTSANEGYSIGDDLVGPISVPLRKAAFAMCLEFLQQRGSDIVVVAYGCYQGPNGTLSGAQIKADAAATTSWIKMFPGRTCGKLQAGQQQTVTSDGNLTSICPN